MKMYAYTSSEPNEEDGIPETSLKISNFEILRCTEIKLYHGISMHLLKKKILDKRGIHQNLKHLFSSWRFSARPGYEIFKSFTDSFRRP
ncbi:hypothetical protein EGN73_02385 [Arthrospiribacter ruber]|uniref:Uncharacterized protein n=1 Tax=Arthrospiribacter ruber TaxID=2487934 RepID=A0A951ISL2_9BACT|nr:hypothetical protein [Arthrospiribacter ruber]